MTDGTMVKWNHAVGQYKELPTITETNDGLIVQYIGESDGYFYKAIKASDYQYIITDIEHEEPEEESGEEESGEEESGEPIPEVEVSIVDYEALDIKWKHYSQIFEVNSFNLLFDIVDNEPKIKLTVVADTKTEEVEIDSIETLQLEWGIDVENMYGILHYHLK